MLTDPCLSHREIQKEHKLQHYFGCERYKREHKLQHYFGFHKRYTQVKLTAKERGVISYKIPFYSIFSVKSCKGIRPLNPFQTKSSIFTDKKQRALSSRAFFVIHFTGIFPVHYFPNVFQIIGFDILVLHIWIRKVLTNQVKDHC